MRRAGSSGWLAHQPLIRADLKQEVQALRSAGIELTVRASQRLPEMETPSRGLQRRPVGGREEP